MRAIGTVFRKEVRENLRDRRSVFTALFFGPLFGPLLLAVALQFVVARGAAESDEPLHVAVSHAEHAPNLMAWLGARNVTVTPVALDDESARAAVVAREYRLVLEVPGQFGTQLTGGAVAPLILYADSASTRDARHVARLRGLLAQYGTTIARLRLQVRGIDPLIATPIVVQAVDVSTAQSRSVTVLGMLSYLVLIAMLLGGLYLAIDATAGERERGSLEPLLTTPVRRADLIYGKILAACAFMLLSLVLTVATCAIALHFVGLASFGIATRLDAGTALAIILVTAPLAPAGAGLMTVVASYTRSYREAQTWLGVLLMLPTLPLVFVGLAELEPTTTLMAVPSLSQHFLIMALLGGESLVPAHVALSAATSLALGVVLAVVAGRLYRRESLLG